MAIEGTALAGLGWVVSPIVKDLVNKIVAYLGSDIAGGLEDLEMILLPQFQITIEAAQHISPNQKAQLAGWLARLKNTCYDAEGILHDLEYKRLKREARGEDKKLLVRLSSKPIIKPLVKKASLLFPEKKKLLDQLNKLKKVAAEAETFRDLLNSIQKIERKDDIIDSNSRSVTSSLLSDKVFGRDKFHDEIINFLLDKQGGISMRKSYSVIAITGMGGIGKTTLAQYVYNDERVKKYFPVRMWLCLSRNIDIIEHTKEMIECVSGKECPNLRNLSKLQEELVKTLPDNIMVVLDDIWYENNNIVAREKQWEIILKPFVSRGGICKIVVTSRSSWLFPKALKPDKIIGLQDLEHDDFKSLLIYCAIDGFETSLPQLKNNFNNIVDQIANKMSRSPLAAKIVGNQLCEWPDIKFWQATLENTTSLTENKDDNVFGRDEERDEIINFLMDKQASSSLRKSYSVISITGVGGIGKTTLAQYVYNDERVKKYFPLRMWLCLYPNIDIIEHTKEMIKCVSGKECPNLRNLAVLQNKLIETLPPSDNIMIILDDVWFENKAGENHEWDKFLIPFALREGTCKFLVTSRSTSYPIALQPEKHIELSELALNDFISHLRYRTITGLQINTPQLKNDLSNLSDLGDIVDKIVTRMSKLPLAAKVVGNQLHEQQDITFWQATLEKVNWSDTMEILLWSFHRLDVQLQRCFLFCSIFPKGTKFDSHKLVPNWVALDFIQSSDDNRNVEDIGLEYFEIMVANSIFQKFDERRYIMNDLYHDLAEKLSAEDCFRIINSERAIPSTVQHVYLEVSNDNLKENLSRISNLRNLRTLILGNPFIDDISEIIPKVSSNFKNLRVLHVMSRGYKKLPRVIGDFRNLRFLSFWESSIEELPDSLLQLYHLQFLQLPSSVKTIPANLSNIIKLRIETYNNDGCKVNT